jgi:hypothetical protein
VLNGNPIEDMWLGIVSYLYTAKNWCLLRCTMYRVTAERKP